MADPIRTEDQRKEFVEFFRDFMESLDDDHCGKGPRRHFTDYPVFILKEEQLITGIDPQFADKLCAVDEDGDIYLSALDAWKTLLEIDEFEKVTEMDEESDVVAFNPTLPETMEEMHISCFSEASEDQQWELLSAIENVSFVTGYDKRWEFESAHLTSDSAEIKRQRLKAKNPNGKYEVFVESNYDNYEYKQIVNALLSGVLGIR